jgi:hypothetical protein
VRKVYLTAVANLLAITPPPPLDAEVLQRVVQEVYAAKDAASAQQLGWYADALNQPQTASQWFKLALDWKPDDEPSAYGLALTRWKIGNKTGVREIQTAWAGRSERIPTVGERSIETTPVRNDKTARAPGGRAIDNQHRQAVTQDYASPRQRARNGRNAPNRRARHPPSFSGQPAHGVGCNEREPGTPTRYSATNGALASGFVTAELHHLMGHDPRLFQPMINNSF